MVIALREREGVGKFLLLGLSADNLWRLRNDEPIHITPVSHPGCPDGWEIVMMFGHTEQQIAQRLKESGAVDDHTRTIAVTKSPQGHQ